MHNSGERENWDAGSMLLFRVSEYMRHGEIYEKVKEDRKERERVIEDQRDGSMQ